MKKLLALAAIASSIASPALADDVDPRAYAFTLTVIYHTGCEKLPDPLMYGIVQAMKTIPEATMIAADEKIHKEMIGDGSGAAWCARMKPIIWKRIKESQ